MPSSTTLLATVIFWLALGAGCTREPDRNVIPQQKLPPPGDWQGRCASRDPRGVLDAVRANDGLKGAPALASQVTDQASILDSAFETQMAGELDAFHVETCHQLAVVTVTSLNGQTVEAYSLALSNRLALGYKGFNNGLMLLLAPTERKARIEIGCGLEDVISDEAASEIVRSMLVPAFRKGDFEAGTRAGMHALMSRARMKKIPAHYRPAGCPPKPR